MKEHNSKNPDKLKISFSKAEPSVSLLSVFPSKAQGRQ